MTEREEILARCAPSLGAMLERRAEETPDLEAFRYRAADDAWASLTWAQTKAQAETLAAGLLSLGLGYEERVSIASSTRMRWILMDLAVSMAAGATTTIYPNTKGEEFAHIVSHSDSRFFVAENAQQLAKLQSHDELRGLVEHVIMMEDDPEASDPRLITWETLVARGTKYLEQHPDCVRDATASTGPDTLATLIYTSGTTGTPKGVELTHQCWTYEAVAVESTGIIEPTDSHLLWLPLSHVFGKCLVAVQLQIGFAAFVDGRTDRIMAGLDETHPTVMCGAPRIYEKVRNAVVTSAPSGGVKGRIARWAFSVGAQTRPYRLKGTPVPRGLAARYAVADRLVFSQLKERMGGKLRYFISGSAKLSRQVQEWFYSAGITIVEGYGLTETSAVTFLNLPDRPRFGTVGPVMPGSEVRIADDGEILVRGPGIMRGYHKAPELTAEVLTDGWFATGDIGTLDEYGYLTITDRKKDLLKTSGGKYVAPQKVENAIAANVPYVSQVVAVGDGRKYISAIVTLDPEALDKWAKRHKKEDLSYEQLTQLPEVRRSIDRFMKRANSKLERWETVKRYAILDHEFSVSAGIMTPNMKVRRAHIAERYADVVESLYDAELPA
ncbi:AMP-dependent synthetase/ligase [Nigerium massiliense]|uniref:AMP-dependent synthetase/ligase n=1 Tax=Nigerium massiliense TaxID=1522317 RepID=UPI00058B3361|nr:long-chain fatty acid--CoA ligase [Nigerium massiliense]